MTHTRDNAMLPLLQMTSNHNKSLKRQEFAFANDDKNIIVVAEKVDGSILDVINTMTRTHLSNLLPKLNYS